MKKPLAWICLAATLTLVASADNEPFKLDVPLGLPDVPKRYELSQDKIDLGKKLFFEKRFSFTGRTSCGSCHIQEHGMADFLPLGFTSFGATLQRNTPTALNAVYNDYQFWDGREPSLEGQVGEVFHAASDENVNLEDAVAKLKTLQDYQDCFLRVFGAEPTKETFCHAIACYENTLLSGNTRFDRFLFAGEQKALTPLEKKGYYLFTGKANCVQCHQISPPTEGSKGYALFMDQQFHNLGVGFQKDGKMLDGGRFTFTAKRSDFGAFKTPTLRNVELTFPYMHNGSMTSLEEVVEFKNRGGNANPNLDSKMKPLLLSTEEKHALVAFLKSLTDEKYKRIEMGVPQLVDRIRKGTAP